MRDRQGHGQDCFHDSFLKRQKEGSRLIFCRTKMAAVTLCKKWIAMRMPFDVLQGDLMQKVHEKVMRPFKRRRVQFVLATVVAAIGINFEGLSFVIHHQLSEVQW